MEKFFLKIYDFFARGRRKWALIIPCVLAILFAGAACLINMDEDIAGFLPYGSGKAHRQSQFIYKNLRMADKIMIVISADNLKDYKETAEDSLAIELGDTITETDKRVNVLTRAADDFSDRFDMSGIKGVKDAQTRVDAIAYMNVSDFLVSNMPYFLEKEDYDRADSIIASGSFTDILKEDKQLILSPQGTVMQQAIVSDPLHFSAPILKRLGQMGMDSDYKIIGEYLFTGDTTRIIMSLTSAYGGSETRRNKQLVKGLEKIRDSVVAENSSVKIDFLGSPVIAVTNSVRMHKDSVRCSLLALILIIILLGWYFRKVKPIILICIPVVFGVLFGLAWMGLFQTSVSAIALSASSVILGIGVDYSLVYSTRLGFVGNSRHALKDIVSPMVTGNITTVGAFFSLLVMSAAGMRDFGLFAAISLIGVILFVVIFLPHWVGEKQYKSRENGWLGRWSNLKIEEKNWVVWGVVIATVILFFFSQKVKFNGDFNKINYMTDRQRADMEEFNAHTAAAGNVAVYAVAQGNTLDEALTQHEALEPFAEKAVGSHISLQRKGIGGFLPSRKKGRCHPANHHHTEWQRPRRAHQTRRRSMARNHRSSSLRRRLVDRPLPAATPSRNGGRQTRIQRHGATGSSPTARCRRARSLFGPSGPTFGRQQRSASYKTKSSTDYHADCPASSSSTSRLRPDRTRKATHRRAPDGANLVFTQNTAGTLWPAKDHV
jgi:hypothetical protein